MQVLVYGGGAVGLGLASCLIQAGARVHILARAATVAALRVAGLRRSGIFGALEAPPGSFASYGRLDDIPSGTVFDTILICVKSFDTAVAALDLATHPALAGPRTHYVLCQNGWGNREAFLACCPGWPVYSARVITGFRRPRENWVEVTVHADDVHLGALGGEALAVLDPLCAALCAGGLPCRVTSRIGHDLWAKMLYNCSLNPLGAIFDAPYGALAAAEPARQMMDAIHEEIFAVLHAAGYQTHWPDARAYQACFYGQLVPATAAHFSSTLQDIRAGKRTEIDALSGAIVALGDRHGCAAPVNETFYRLIKFRESLAQTPRGPMAA